MNPSAREKKVDADWKTCAILSFVGSLMTTDWVAMLVPTLKYWIFDQDQTPRRFPLQRLLRHVREVAGTNVDDFEVTRAWGYGLQINAWAKELDTADRITVTFAVLDKLSAGDEEWFYDLVVSPVSVNIQFGLHDSTALFVAAPPDIAQSIVSAFADVRLAETR